MPDAFASGSMRTAHHMIDLTTPREQSKYVLKLSKDPRYNGQSYFEDVKMQMIAKMYAEKYNAQDPPKHVDFVDVYVLQLIDRPTRPLCTVEPFIEGKYVKYNNNWDWVDDRRNTPQAFSHFTWIASGQALLVCDIQGVGDRWTDPQIHTRDGRGLGEGNLGWSGIQRFFQSHRCNVICQYLGLPVDNLKSPPGPDSPPGAGPVCQATVLDPTRVIYIYIYPTI
mmetsp:Transcript_77274/g.208584  ORF Transcript_77274/g.208584 Transcript_77274/m.208584 type:complete len:224 (+) Transcript_77274:174-845(+)